VAPPDVLLGTNTSQLSISMIGSTMGDSADRLVGMHFSSIHPSSCVLLSLSRA